MTEKQYLTCVSAYIPFGPVHTKLLLDYFGSAKAIWDVSSEKLEKIGLSLKKADGFDRFRAEFNTKAYFEKQEKLQIDIITIFDKDYPINLKQIDSAPFVIYKKGKLKASDENAIAIVGSRKMTSYGKEVASMFSTSLAGYGLTIVSGLARGIDTQAHKHSLLAGGRTIAVLGCGLDKIYPPENNQLAKEIVKYGALISEFPLGYPAIPINFAARNRIISALSKAVIVVEGAEKSGTLLTASHAADQGKIVFAVPGQITSPLSAAPFYLLKNGAKMLTCIGDILDELAIETMVDRNKVERILPSSKKEEKILTILENEQLHLDEIARISSWDTADVSARLTIMELKGLVKHLGRGLYKKV